jgi:hypothetical protein
VTKRNDREETRERYGNPRRAAELRQSGDWKSLTIPEGIKMFKIKKEGVYRIDILPYRVGAGNPFMEEGKMFYERTYYVHAGVGANNGIYTCPRRTFAKKCPICEFQSQLQQQPGVDKKLVEALNTKTRQIFLILDADHPTDGVQLWEMAHFNFGKLLEQRIGRADGEYDHFYRREGGMTLRVEMSEETAGGGFKFLKATAIDFKARKDIERELLRDLPCLDELVKETPYADLKEVFFQTAPGTTRDGDDRRDGDRRDHRRDDDDDRRPSSRSRDDDDDRPTRSRRDEDDDLPPPRAHARDDDDDDRRATTRSRHDEDDDDRPARTRRDRDDDDGRARGRRTRDDDDDDRPRARSRDRDEDNDRPARTGSRRDEDDDRPARSGRGRDRDDDDDVPY